MIVSQKRNAMKFRMVTLYTNGLLSAQMTTITIKVFTPVKLTTSNFFR